MGANTYIGNGPNLLVKAVAESAGDANVPMPNFLAYAGCAIAILTPVYLAGGGFHSLIHRGGRQPAVAARRALEPGTTSRRVGGLGVLRGETRLDLRERAGDFVGHALATRPPGPRCELK